VQASLDYKQRLQQLFFPEGIAFDGNRFNRTAATAPLFNYLAPSESADEKMVSRVGIEPTTRRLRVQGWMSAGIQRVVLFNDLSRKHPPMSAISTEVRLLGFQLGFQGTRPSACFQVP
jgi:hypothetical protein